MMFFSVRGKDNLAKALKQLPLRMRKQALMRAARVAMRPVMLAARTNSPKGETGDLRKTIKLRALKRKTSSRSIGVRVATSDVWYTGDQYYGAFQEYGWRAGKRTKEMRRVSFDKSQDTRKWIPGKHFMEETYDAYADRAMSTFAAVLPKEIKKLVDELRVKEEWNWFFNK